MFKPLYILNGPNLNRLGRREPEIYGKATLAEIESDCRRSAGEQPLVFRQTNSEQQLIHWIHQVSDEGGGITSRVPPPWACWAAQPTISVGCGLPGARRKSNHRTPASSFPIGQARPSR